MHDEKLYRTKTDGPIKQVTYLALGCHYITSWGEEQTFDTAHYRIDISGENPYGCELKAFHDTHIPVKGGWLKSCEVWAYRSEKVHNVKCVVDGKLEEEGPVPVGHWVVKNPGGEKYAMPPEKFEERYE